MTMPNTLQEDFSGAYMAVRTLCSRVEDSTEKDLVQCAELLGQTLSDRTHSSQSRAYFLYREAALGLAAIMRSDPSLAERCHAILQDTVVASLKEPCLAAAEALGSLPVDLPGPGIQVAETTHPRVCLDELGKAASIRFESIGWKGRTLLFRARKNGHLLAVKCAREGESPHSLEQEALWMEHIRNRKDLLPERFFVPRPLSIHGSHCFRLDDPAVASQAGLHPRRYAMAYTTADSYFVYANDPQHLPPDRFLELMRNCALGLGRLARQGILHTALIPLFHNRVQQARRNDMGHYLWMRMGRLDRWLDSCRHPNLGLSGIRDFEHFQSFRSGGRDFFRIVGEQFLSLFLTTGSYFRAREPELRGRSSNGQPVDCRSLFEPEILTEILEGIVRSYYLGLVGRPFPTSNYTLQDNLVHRMVDEMGVDRYMEEIVRVEDQMAMTPGSLRALLISGGMEAEHAASVEPGVQEIRLMTGPHLGDFNGAISLPELPLFVAGAASCCIAGLFLNQIR